VKETLRELKKPELTVPTTPRVYLEAACHNCSTLLDHPQVARSTTRLRPFFLAVTQAQSRASHFPLTPLPAPLCRPWESAEQWRPRYFNLPPAYDSLEGVDTAGMEAVGRLSMGSLSYERPGKEHYGFLLEEAPLWESQFTGMRQVLPRDITNHTVNVGYAT